MPGSEVVGTVPLIGLPHPFSSERSDEHLPVGVTFSEMIDHLGVKPQIRAFCHIVVCDREMKAEPQIVPPHLWECARPKAGMVVTVRAVPAGGGGGKGGGKMIFGLVLGLAFAAIGFYLGPLAAGLMLGKELAGTFGFSLLSGAISAAVGNKGPMVHGCLLPPEGL